MAVVINDFEVMPETTTNRAAESAALDQATPPASCSPHEVEQALRQQLERLARVAAH